MKKVRLSTFENNWYQPGNRFKILVWYFVNILFLMNPLNPISGLKILFLRLFGAKIGKGVLIKPAVNIKYPWLLEVGDNVWIGEKVWIDNLAKVVIMDNTCISQGAMLLCGNHNYKSTSFDLMMGEITIEEGCWVGAYSVVCPGVVLASHSILSVNSVANRNTESYSIYQGNPAVKIRSRVIDVGDDS